MSAVTDSPDATLGTDLVVYGVVDEASLTDAGRAVFERHGLQLVTDGSLAAVVGTDHPASARDAVVQHAKVLDDVATECAVVPVRFGTLMPTEAVRDELIAPRRDELQALLASLAGRRQYRVRAGFVEEWLLGDIVSSDAEVAALRERTRGASEEASYADRVRLGELVARQVERRADAEADDLLAAIAPLADAHVVRERGGLERLLDLAVLVDVDRESELEQALEELARERDGRIRLSLSGPTAPYDFVEDPTWAS